MILFLITLFELYSAGNSSFLKKKNVQITYYIRLNIYERDLIISLIIAKHLSNNLYETIILHNR